MKSLPSKTRLVMALAGAVLLAAASGAQVTLKPNETDPVKIDGGLISGTYLLSGVEAYLGVPFAAPPYRENRWREPQPIRPWQGIWTANRSEAECVQGSVPITSITISAMKMLPRIYPVSNDAEVRAQADKVGVEAAGHFL